MKKYAFFLLLGLTGCVVDFESGVDERSSPQVSPYAYPSAAGAQSRALRDRHARAGARWPAGVVWLMNAHSWVRSTADFGLRPRGGPSHCQRPRAVSAKVLRSGPHHPPSADPRRP